MDKKCLLTFFSVPLIFLNYLYIKSLRIYSVFIRRTAKRGKKYSSERRNRIKSRFYGDFRQGKFVDFNKFSAYCIR